MRYHLVIHADSPLFATAGFTIPLILLTVDRLSAQGFWRHWVLYVFPSVTCLEQPIGRTVGYPPIELPIVGASSGTADVVNLLHVPMAGVRLRTMTTTSTRKTRICGSGICGMGSRSTRDC
jgi:hypothetical protein